MEEYEKFSEKVKNLLYAAKAKEAFEQVEWERDLWLLW